MQHPKNAAEALRRMRTSGPLVHNITNYVAMDVSANVLLAIGAAPAMVHAVEEVESFTRISSSLAINIGTLSAPWVASMHAARNAAHAAGIPVVLDPVGAGATPYRTRTALDLLAAGVQVVRGNASEILALAGAAAPRGVDTAHEVSEALDAARAIARKFTCVVAVTGARDAVTDGERVMFVEGGHPLMAKVTALGCALTGVIAAFMAVNDDALVATSSALAVYSVAGELAAAGAEGPASFRARFIDALHRVSPEEVEARARIEG
jgi:hydroxyethylthiazole kinase